MKISELIKKLEEFKQEYGDVDCWYAIDEEGNDFKEIYYDPSLRYVDFEGDTLSEEDVKECLEDGEHDTFTKICVVN